MKRSFTFPWRSRRRIADDVSSELAFHLQSRAADLVAAGMTPQDALAQARREFGDVEDARRYMEHVDSEIERTQRRREHMRDLWQDVRYAARRMRSAPVFTAAAVATLAIGIGANTAVFSVVDAALLRPLPYPNADRVVSAYTLAPWGHFVSSPTDFVDWRAQSHAFEEMAAVDAYPRTITGVGEPRSTPAARVSHGFFKILGVAPSLGRVFDPSEEEFGNTKFVVISHALWQQSFGSRPDIVGQHIDLDGASHTIVGVMPARFEYPGRTQLWLPLAFSAKDLATQRGAHYLDVLALLKPDVTLQSADADLRAVEARLAQQYPNTDKDYSATVSPLRDALVGSTPKRALLVLMGAVALVALIACANVANLVLARGTARAREIAVRLALGATSRDLAYMALTESALLALCGGAAGWVLARALAGTLDALRPDSLRQMGDLHIQLGAGLFTLALSLVAGLMFGLAPALQASRRRQLQPALAAGGRADAGDRRAGSFRSALVAAEIALAVVLTSGAGLLVKSLAKLEHQDTGFDANHMLAFSLSLPDGRYHSSALIAQTYDEIVRRVQAVPGVESAAATMFVPLDGNRFSISTKSIDGVEFPPDQQPSNEIRVVSAGALSTLRAHLVAGRMFDANDRLGAAPVVIVNQTSARRLWKDQNPVGHTIMIGTHFTEDTVRAHGTVIGVVSDMRDVSVGQEPSPIVYFPHAQAPVSDMGIVVRVAPGMEPLALVSAISAQVHSVDPLLPVVDPRTMDDVVAYSVAQPRFATLLMSVFATLALLLALIGVWGVMAYVVSQRTREIGIRMALGASGRRVVRETLARASAPLFAGIALGLVGALLVSRLMANLLYDVAPRDPGVLAVVVVVLTVVGLAAAYGPARRASVVDPLIAVRND